MSEETSDPRLSPVWDAGRYERFRLERARPFHDLLARVPDGAVRQVADLGCGTGELTRTLRDRWPAAEVWGVDTSEEMLNRAADAPLPAGLRFVRADLSRWEPPGPLDRIVANAALHWVPDHASLLRRLAGLLAPGGVIAAQIPNNRGEIAYRILRALLDEEPWATQLPNGYRASVVETASWYEERLRDLGMSADVWETIYYHRLEGPAEIVEWLRGSTLRPTLTGIEDDVSADFLAACTEKIAASYPPAPNGVLFPFRRLFFIGAKGSDPEMGRS